MGVIKIDTTEAYLDKSAKSYNEFQYEEGNSIQLLQELIKINNDIKKSSDDVVNALQTISNTYSEFTDFEGLLSTSRNNINKCVSDVKTSVENFKKIMQETVEALAKEDETLLGDLGKLSALLSGSELVNENANPTSGNGGGGKSSGGETNPGGGVSNPKPTPEPTPAPSPSPAPTPTGGGLNPSSSLYNKLGGDTSTLNQMVSWLKNKGLNNAQIAGIIGNSALESGLQLNAKNPSSSATGLFQWLSNRHPSGWDFETQMNHMWNEYTSTRTDSKGNPVSTHMDGITDPTVACQQFCKYFEGASSGSKREQYARDAFEYLNSNFV